MARRTAAKAGPDADDIAPDVYMVTPLEPGSYQVRHFPDRTTTKACCNIRVDVTDEDRRQGVEVDDPAGRIPALARATRAIDKKHGW